MLSDKFCPFVQKYLGRSNTVINQSNTDTWPVVTCLFYLFILFEVSVSYKNKYLQLILNNMMSTLWWDRMSAIRRVWRYQRGNQNRISKKNRQNNDQKKKVQKDKQRSTKHTYKTKDRVTRTPQKTGGELMCSGRVSSSCSTNGIRGVNLVTNPVISHEWGKDREVFTTSGTYPWSLVTQIFHNGQPSHGGDRKTVEVMTST
jgi:hypothetical protein